MGYKARGIFVFSRHESLTIESDLLKSLGLDPEWLGQRNGRKRTAMWVAEAQHAWGRVYRRVATGKLNFFIWLHDLLAESTRAGVWIPRAVILRLREFQRRELVVMIDSQPVEWPLHYGLPREFQQACSDLGWTFPEIVPGLRAGEFVWLRGDYDGRCIEEFLAAWRVRPAVADVSELRRFVANQLKAAGWTVPQSFC